MRKVRQSGFTLIELMITVVIVGILAAVAYPGYIQYVVKAKRSSVQGFMLNVANRQEQSMLNARQYFSVATGAPSEWTAVSMAVPKEVSDNYTVKVTANNVAGTLPTYTVTATPFGAQATGDTKCAELTLDQKGTKGKTGTAAAVTDCW